MARRVPVLSHGDVWIEWEEAIGNGKDAVVGIDRQMASGEEAVPAQKYNPGLSKRKPSSASRRLSRPAKTTKPMSNGQ